LSNKHTERMKVIAISQAENTLRAICLRKHENGIEVLWTKSRDINEGGWGVFAIELTQDTKADCDRVVVGFNSTGIAFYQLTVPPVKADELDSIVKLQTEARLPLPAEHTQLTWRVGNVRDGQTEVVVAAARTEPLKNFVEDVRAIKPSKILLNSEAIVKAWRQLFSETYKVAMVVSIGTNNTQVCLARAGQLANAVTVDIGSNDFSEGRVETTQRFVQDIKSARDLFSGTNHDDLPVVILSDGGDAIDTVFSSFLSAGLDVREALPNVQKLQQNTYLDIKDVYEYRVPIGLGLMALDGDAEGLNIFERLYSPAKKAEKKSTLYSPKIATVIATVMLALLIMVFYVVDVVSEKHLTKLRTETDYHQLVSRQKLIKNVATQRIDLLKLLKEVSVDGSKDITLDILDFKRGRPVTISGQAKAAEQLYKFQKGLLAQKGIKNVRIQSMPQDSKTKKLKFTITFDYRNFTKKTGYNKSKRSEIP